MLVFDSDKNVKEGFQIGPLRISSFQPFSDSHTNAVPILTSTRSLIIEDMCSSCLRTHDKRFEAWSRSKSRDFWNMSLPDTNAIESAKFTTES